MHPGGDNFLIGSYDNRVCWFDLDLSSKPYKVMKYHAGSVRSVAFHRHFPLFASAGDDASIHVFHGYSFYLFDSFLFLIAVILIGSFHSQNGLSRFDAKRSDRSPQGASARGRDEERIWGATTSLASHAAMAFRLLCQRRCLDVHGVVHGWKRTIQLNDKKKEKKNEE